MAESNFTESGWEEPTDDSPVQTPDDWQGGSVVHTGGNILNRIWTCEDGNIRYEVGYDDSFQGAQLTKYEYRDDTDLWEFAGSIAHRDADEQTDHSCAKVARELMREADELDDI